MGMHTCVQTWDPFKLIYDWKHNQYMRHTGHTVNTKIDQFNSLPLQVFHRFPRGNSQCFGQGTPTSEAVEESEFVGTVEVDERVSGGGSTNLWPLSLEGKIARERLESTYHWHSGGNANCWKHNQHISTTCLMFWMSLPTGLTGTCTSCHGLGETGSIA